MEAGEEMKMPYQCFICRDWRHNCGHREPELVQFFLGDDAIREAAALAEYTSHRKRQDQRMKRQALKSGGERQEKTA